MAVAKANLEIPNREDFAVLRQLVSVVESLRYRSSHLFCIATGVEVTLYNMYLDTRFNPNGNPGDTPKPTSLDIVRR